MIFVRMPLSLTTIISEASRTIHSQPRRKLPAERLPKLKQNTRRHTKRTKETLKMETKNHIPAAWQKHRLFNKDWTRQEDVPAGPNVIRTAEDTDKHYTHTENIPDTLMMMFRVERQANRTNAWVGKKNILKWVIRCGRLHHFSRFPQKRTNLSLLACSQILSKNHI